MADKLGRYIPKSNGPRGNLGRYVGKEQSLEKYKGKVSTLASYCNRNKNQFCPDWTKERIECTEENTIYAMNVIKTYSQDPENNKIIASYCGLYMYNNYREFNCRKENKKVYIQFGEVDVVFCKNSGISCISRSRCNDNQCCDDGFWIVSIPFFFLFLLIIFALALSRRG